MLLKIGALLAMATMLAAIAPSRDSGPQTFKQHKYRTAAIRCNFNLEAKNLADGAICLSERAQCEAGCTDSYNAEAVMCAVHGFTAQAAICHAENTVSYGACLVVCRSL